MNRFFPSFSIIAAFAVAAACLLGASALAQSVESTYNGHRIIIPQSSIPEPGRHHTNYFLCGFRHALAQRSAGRRRNSRFDRLCLSARQWTEWVPGRHQHRRTDGRHRRNRHR